MINTEKKGKAFSLATLKKLAQVDEAHPLIPDLANALADDLDVQAFIANRLESNSSSVRQTVARCTKVLEAHPNGVNLAERLANDKVWHVPKALAENLSKQIAFRHLLKALESHEDSSVRWAAQSQRFANPDLFIDSAAFTALLDAQIPYEKLANATNPDAIFRQIIPTENYSQTAFDFCRAASLNTFGDIAKIDKRIGTVKQAMESPLFASGQGQSLLALVNALDGSSSAAYALASVKPEHHRVIAEITGDEFPFLLADSSKYGAIAMQKISKLLNQDQGYEIATQAWGEWEASNKPVNKKSMEPLIIQLSEALGEALPAQPSKPVYKLDLRTP